MDSLDQRAVLSVDKKEEVVPVPAPGLTRTRERDLLRPVKRVKPRLTYKLSNHLRVVTSRSRFDRILKDQLGHECDVIGIDLSEMSFQPCL